MRRVLVVLALLLCSPAGAHELADNRATLVLRDGRHLTMTLYIAWAEALHAALAPKRPPAEFLAIYSAMKPEDLQKQLSRAQAGFQAATRLYLAEGPELSLSNWVWPDAKQVQDLLRQRMMQAMVDPGNGGSGGHSHEEPVEIRADAVAPREITSVRVRVPEEFRNVLVVAYRPSQLWVEPRTLSPAIRF